MVSGASSVNSAIYILADALNEHLEGSESDLLLVSSVSFAVRGLSGC